MDDPLIYCYHCRSYHPRSQMRKVATRGVSRFRCIASIQAVKKPQKDRDDFGRQITEINRREAARVSALARHLK